MSSGAKGPGTDKPPHARGSAGHGSTGAKAFALTDRARGPSSEDGPELSANAQVEVAAAVEAAAGVAEVYSTVFSALTP